MGCVELNMEVINHAKEILLLLIAICSSMEGGGERGKH